MPRRFALGAAAVAVLAAVAVPGVLAPKASAATPGYVGIVISGLGEHDAYCVRWHSGMTGDELLNDVAAVTYRQQGFILTINGQPADAKASPTAYWSYWEDAAGAWSYSQSGAAGTAPPAGSVDGWSWGDGSAPPAGYPSGGLYAALCGHLDASTTTRPATHSALPATHSVAAPGGSVAVDGTSSSAVPTTSAPRTPTGSRAASPPVNPMNTVYAVVPGSGTVSASASPVAATRHHHHGSPWPAIVAVLIACVLLGGAGVIAVRRNRADPAA